MLFRKRYNEYDNIIRNLEKEKKALVVENQNLKNEVRNLKSSIDAARVGEKEITNVKESEKKDNENTEKEIEQINKDANKTTFSKEDFTHGPQTPSGSFSTTTNKVSSPTNHSTTMLTTLKYQKFHSVQKPLLSRQRT